MKAIKFNIDVLVIQESLSIFSVASERRPTFNTLCNSLHVLCADSKKQKCLKDKHRYSVGQEPVQLA